MIVEGTIRFEFTDWDQLDLDTNGSYGYGHTVTISVPELDLVVNSGSSTDMRYAIETCAQAVEAELTKLGMRVLTQRQAEVTS